MMQERPIAPSGRSAQGLLLAGAVFAAGIVVGLPRPGAAVEVLIQEAQFNIDENQVVSWVCNNHSTIASARESAVLLLQARIDAADHACALSPSQRNKLELAGQGDIQRFFNKFESERRTLPTGQMTQQEYEKLWERIQPYRTEWSSGLHPRESLFVKSVRSTLDSEQFGRYEEFQRQRNRQHYAGLVKTVVAMIENDIPLTAEQRERLLDAMLAQEPPRNVNLQSSYKVYVVMYQLARIPPEKLKPIFLENEWVVMSALIERAKQLRNSLQASGVEFD